MNIYRLEEPLDPDVPPSAVCPLHGTRLYGDIDCPQCEEATRFNWDAGDEADSRYDRETDR